MNRQPKTVLTVVAASCLAAAFLSACASTGGGGAPSAPAAAPKADVRNEVGANGLPTPAALLARYVDAIGGEQALRAHTSATRKGKMSIPAMGMEGTITAHLAAPDKMVMNIETGMGSMNQGYNGEIGWSDNPMMGAQVLSGEQLDAMKLQADFYAPLNYDKHFTSMETVEETTWNGESAYRVKVVSPSGRESSLFFGKDSGFLLGTQGVQQGPMGEAEVKVSFSDYQDFGGSKVPGKTTIDTSGMQIEQVTEAVTYDDVDPSAFEPPASVKAMLAK